MKRMLPAVVAMAGLVLVTFGIQSQAQAQGADDRGQVEAGQLVYETSCAGCHGADGGGVAGRGRPLIGIASQGDRGKHIDSITNGIGGMPAFGERLSSSEIEQAASYVRLTFVEAEAATAAEQPTELAMTGINSETLAVAGVAMLAGGVQLLIWSRRRDGS